MTPAIPALRAPAPVARWLAGKTPGERRAVAVIAAAAGTAALWAAIWQPLVRDTEAMRFARSGNIAALAAARTMTEEAAGLARAAVAPNPADARAGLERVLGQRNLRSAVTQLDWQDNRARVVFAAVGYDALIAGLEALQRDEKLRTVAAAINARVEPGMVRAEITLAR